jgi:SRSO17 transposase
VFDTLRQARKPALFLAAISRDILLLVSALAEGKQDPLFEKKPELAIKLIDLTLSRGYQPGIVIIDGGYGNNVSFLLKLENRKLKYLGGLAKNRKVTVNDKQEIQKTIR